jgi:formylglycine-generating enzyme required for sulfatase activity
VASVLGRDFEARDELLGERRLPTLLHRATKLVFVVIPGGRFEMGLSDGDIEEAAELIDVTGGVANFIAELKRTARPTREVRVAPFVCCRQTTPPKQVKVLSKRRFEFSTPSAQDAAAFMAVAGFRLPSEAELEWLARDGGSLHFTYDAVRTYRNEGRWPTVGGFGVEDLLVGEWAADEKHRSYKGAPADSSPWSQGGPPGVYRGGAVDGPGQSDEEMIGALAANRRFPPEGMTPDATVRLVSSLPTD